MVDTLDIDTTTTINDDFSDIEFESCIDDFPIFDGDGDISIDINNIYKKIRIRITGPDSKWFGVGFGNNIMINTYSIVITESDFNVNERILGDEERGIQIEYSTFDELNKFHVAPERIISVIRDYDDIIYDFTDFAQCKINEMDIIWALGSELSFGYHLKRSNETLISCSCNDQETENQSHATWLNVDCVIILLSVYLVSVLIELDA